MPDTPFLVVDRPVLDRNLRALQDYCDAHGLAFRPHVKTHKTSQILAMQVELGARGVTCQKLGEAEELARPDIDTLIAFNLVGDAKLERLAAVARESSVSVSVDDLRVARAISSSLQGLGVSVGVWIDCDTGLGRTGVGSSQEAASLATAIRNLPSLELRGLFTYPLPPPGSWLEQAIVGWDRAGLFTPAVSVGATPTAYETHELGYATELRAGTYVFNDLESVQTGSARFDDCALILRATCVSRPEAHRAVIDAGSKALGLETIDLGDGPVYGALRDRPHIGVAVVYEEHGVLRAEQGNDLPDLGDCVDIVPAHCCYAVNLHDELHVEADGVQIDRWAVAARGAVR